MRAGNDTSFRKCTKDTSIAGIPAAQICERNAIPVPVPVL
jgi:hypothetical protein